MRKKGLGKGESYYFSVLPVFEADANADADADADASGAVWDWAPQAGPFCVQDLLHENMERLMPPQVCVCVCVCVCVDDSVDDGVGESLNSN